MKIKDFLPILERACKVVPKKNTSIVNGIYFNRDFLCATDIYDISYKAAFNDNPVTTFPFVLQEPRKLLNALSLYKHTDLGFMFHEKGTARVAIELENRSFCFKIESADEFPFPSKDFKKIASGTLSKEAANKIANVGLAISENDNRFNLCGLCFRLKDKTLTMIGSDGRRLHVAETPIKSEVYDQIDKFDALETYVNWRDIQSYLPFLNDSFQISFSETHTQFTMDSKKHIWTFQNLDSAPDKTAPYNTVMELPFELCGCYRRADLEEMLKLSKVFLHRQHPQLIFEGNQISSHTDKDAASFQYTAQTAIDERIVINGNYLRDALKLISGDKIYVAHVDKAYKFFGDGNRTKEYAIIMGMNL